MTQWSKKSFTLPASGERKTEEPCLHAWIDSRGNCVLCGKREPEDDFATQLRKAAQAAAKDGRVDTTGWYDSDPRHYCEEGE